jgi:hypothetical protein
MHLGGASHALMFGTERISTLHLQKSKLRFFDGLYGLSVPSYYVGNHL